jgi:hypothetical protein
VKRSGLIAFVVAVDLAAVLALFLLPAGSTWVDWPQTAFLVLVTGIVGCFSVRIPALRSEMAPTQPFILLALAALGPLAGWIVSLGSVVGSLPMKHRRRSGMRLAFNMGTVPLSTAVASVVFMALGGAPGAEPLQLVAPLTSAALTFFLCNTGLVAIAISLEKNRDLLSTWGGSFLWTLVPCLGGLSMALAMYVAIEISIAWVLLIGAPPCFLLVDFYRVRARDWTGR